MAELDVKALLFDVFGTVVDWRSTIVREGEALGARKDLEVDWAAFADAWRLKYQPAMAKVRDGSMPWTKLDTLHRMNLEEVLAEFGMNGLTAAEVDHLNKVWHRLDPWPDAVEGLGRLKTRFIVATLSNGNVAMMVNMAKRAGLPWDAILGAEVARHYKPDPEAYLISASLLDLAPAECLMVAAHNSDLAAAGECGLKCAFVRRPTEWGAGQTFDVEPAKEYDVVADDFVDLARRLGC